MRRRDWAGTVLVACLIALAGLLRDHELVVGLLLAAAVVSGVVIAWDRRLARARVRQPPTGIRAGHGIRAGGDIESDAGIDAGWGIEAGGSIRQITARTSSASARSPLLGRELGHVLHELDALLGIVQSDAPAGYSVPRRRKELADIGCTVRRLLTARPELWTVYDSPLPEPQPDGQLMDHDERIFEAQLHHRRDMLAEVIGRLELPPAERVE